MLSLKAVSTQLHSRRSAFGFLLFFSVFYRGKSVNLVYLVDTRSNTARLQSIRLRTYTFDDLYSLSNCSIHIQIIREEIDRSCNPHPISFLYLFLVLFRQMGRATSLDIKIVKILHAVAVSGRSLRNIVWKYRDLMRSRKDNVDDDLHQRWLKAAIAFHLHTRDLKVTKITLDWCVCVCERVRV